jgi:hypothetical protein
LSKDFSNILDPKGVVKRHFSSYIFINEWSLTKSIRFEEYQECPVSFIRNTIQPPTDGNLPLSRASGHKNVIKRSTANQI